MNNTDTGSSSEKLTAFAWCLLVAIKLAQQDGKGLSDMQLHVFIMQWLSEAQKQKRFPKDIAADILWLLDQGRRYGVRANLFRKVDYIWRSGAGVLSEQSDLFRLTYFIEMLKDRGWAYHLEQGSRRDRDHTSPADSQHVYLSRRELQSHYNNKGMLLRPLTVHFSKAIEEVGTLLMACSLTGDYHTKDDGATVVILHPT